MKKYQANKPVNTSDECIERGYKNKSSDPPRTGGNTRFKTFFCLSSTEIRMGKSIQSRFNYCKTSCTLVQYELSRAEALLNFTEYFTLKLPFFQQRLESKYYQTAQHSSI